MDPEKRILKRVFIWGSIAFLSFMVFFYGYRLVHYFVKEHRPDDKVYSMIGYLKVEDNLINNYFDQRYKNSINRVSLGLQSTNNKLLKDGDCYYFRKDAQNNYLLFSGILYRILYLDKENIYLMSDEPVTNLKYGITGEYDKSNIKVWLENIYLNNLNSEYLSSKEVTLLDKDTFQKIGGNESYIIGKPFWMVEDNKGLIVDEDGEVGGTYPNSHTYPKRIIAGTTCKAQMVFGVNNRSNKVKLQFWGSSFWDNQPILIFELNV